MTATDTSGLFQPLTIRGATIPNRIVMAPMTRNFSPDGVPGDNVATYYAKRAAGGTGLIVSEGAGVDHPAAVGEATFGETAIPMLYGDDAFAGWAKLIEGVHAHGSLFMPQLWHMGVMRPEGTGPFPAAPTVSPSGSWGPTDRKTTVGAGYAEKWATPLEPASDEVLQEVIDAFGRSAGFAKRAGADGIAIHGAHGYLIDTFLWPETNSRTDRFGPSIETRSAFAVEVVKAIRAAVGEDMPILFRFSQWKQQDVYGRIADTPDELGKMLGPMADAGVDIFDASVRYFDTPAFEGSPLNLAGWAKKVTGKAAMAVGGVGLSQGMYDTANKGGDASNNLDKVMARFDAGEFDLLGVGRAHLADPEWARKARMGKAFAPLEPGHLSELI